jgi:hypothetical protein
MKKQHAVLILFAITFFFALQPQSVTAQTASGAGSTAQSQAQTTSPSSSSAIVLTYHRPTEGEKLRNYAFDSFGPYAFVGSIAAAGYQQADTPGSTTGDHPGIPPDWGQGWGPFGERVASNFGINLVTQTARYSMAEVLREDTIYYRCECSGFFPRLGHALVSTVTARRGEDGHRVISISAIASPYAGTEAAALGWYPGRYNAMDGFRMGNYNLLLNGALNVALEFIWGGPHTLLSHHHVPILSNATGSSGK